MEGNSTFTGNFGTAAVGAVLSIERILALIANGIVLLITVTQRKSWKQSSTIFFSSLILAHLVLSILYLPFISILLLVVAFLVLQMRRKEEHVTFHLLSTGTLY